MESETRAVEAQGSIQVTPSDSTTYTLSAKGPGGFLTASTRVTVIVPAPLAPAPESSEDELFAGKMKDVYFDFDAWKIRSDQQSAIEQNVAFLTPATEYQLYSGREL
jgi:peptidoglycan-associated lipoprotein